MTEVKHAEANEIGRVVGDGLTPLIPDRSHYGLNYIRCGRMSSFTQQIEAVLGFEPARVLEIGPGPGIVTHTLRVAGVEVTTLDIEPTLSPTLLGSVDAIPLPDGAVDACVCCQVLEHLPFERFVPAMKELRRVCTKGAVISLPDNDRFMFIDCKAPFLPRRTLSVSIPRNKSRSDEQMKKLGHYWEIGLAGMRTRTVITACREAGWRLRRTWRNRDLSWHRFFVLERA